MKIGYVRVSAKTQNIARQLEAMKKLGIHERFLFQDVLPARTLNVRGISL